MRNLATKLKRRLQIASDPLPRSLNIELTNTCNSKCSMCPRENMVQSKQMKVGHIDYNFFKDIVDSSARNKNTIFTLVGLGEPLLYPKLQAAIKYILKKCPTCPIRISSNGIALNETNARMLIKSLDAKDKLTISLNADNPKAYQWLMGVDRYNVVTTNIKNFLLLRKKINGGKAPSLVIQLLITKKTKNSAERFNQEWQPLVMPQDKISIKSLLNWGGKINTKTLGVANKGKRFPCYSLWTIISVDREGNVYPCCEAFSSREKSQLLLGNLRDESLANIYNEKIKFFRDKHLNGQWSSIQECAKCDFWSDAPNIWFEISGKWF